MMNTVRFNGLDDVRELRSQDLHFNSLLVLQVLLRTTSVSAAANVLQIGQPAVSKILQTWRGKLDDQLLVRSSNRMYLTERARSLLPLLDDMVANARLMFEAGGFSPLAERRAVRIALNDYMQEFFAGKLAALVSAEAPSVQLVFRPAGENSPSLLAEGKLDMVIGTDWHDLQRMRMRTIGKMRIVCVASRGQNRTPPELAFAEFCNHPQIDVSPSGHGTMPRLIDLQTLRNGESRNVVHSISSYLALPAMLGETGAIALVPQCVAQSRLMRDELRMIELRFPAPTIDIHMSWHNVTNSDVFHCWTRDRIAQAMLQ